MKISVKKDGRRELLILFLLPLFQPAFRHCAAGIINKCLRDKGVLDRNITAGQLHQLSRTIMKYKRRHPRWNLVEVHSKEGDDVIIRL